MRRPSMPSLLTSLSRARLAARAVLCSLFFTCAASAQSQTEVLVSVDDNTLIQATSGVFSAGAAQYFFAGRVGVNGEGTLRRGALRFDLSSLPVNATIQSVSLRLYCSAVGLPNQFPIALKRLLAPWGEAGSVAFGGGGAPPEPGDATWVHRFFPNEFWTAPGGDFVQTASATRNVGAVGFYTWNSTPALVADVQGWVTSPATNHGWLVQGNETTLQSAKRFDSREAGPTTRPQLTVIYTIGVVGDLNGDGKVNSSDLAILLGNWGGTGVGNIDNIGVVDAADLAFLLSKWTG